MTKEYCDRCNKEIKVRKSLEWLYVRLMIQGDKEEWYDLCPECYKEIKAFIHNYKATDKMED